MFIVDNKYQCFTNCVTDIKINLRKVKMKVYTTVMFFYISISELATKLPCQHFEQCNYVPKLSSNHI